MFYKTSLPAKHNGIWYHINYLKSTNNIPAKFFRYLLYYLKPDTVSIIISVIMHRSSIIDIHFKVTLKMQQQKQARSLSITYCHIQCNTLTQCIKWIIYLQPFTLLKCVKLCLKKSKKKSGGLKMYTMNIHLTVISLTFNKHSISYVL